MIIENSRFHFRDKSSPVTFYYKSPEDAKEDKRTWIHQYHLNKTEFKSDHYKIRNNQVPSNYHFII